MSTVTSSLIPVGTKVVALESATGSKRNFIGKDLYVASNSYHNTSEPYLLTETEGSTSQSTGYSWKPTEIEIAWQPVTPSDFLAKQLKLRIGDKVKVNFKPNKNQWEALIGGTHSWQTAMDARVGQEGRVVAIVDNSRYRVRFDDKSSYTFPAISLQLITKAPESESVTLNDRYTGVVTIEGVLIDEGRRYSFDVFERLGELIKNVKETKTLLKPVTSIGTNNNGTPLFNKAIAESMDLKKDDKVKIALDLTKVASLYGLKDWTSRMRDWIGETLTIVSVDEEGYATMDNDLVFPAMALNKTTVAEKMRLGYNWEAEVFPTHVQVGCQRYEFTAFEKLNEVIAKFKALVKELQEETTAETTTA